MFLLFPLEHGTPKNKEKEKENSPKFIAVQSHVIKFSKIFRLYLSGLKLEK